MNFEIPGEVRSKKNSKQAFFRGGKQTVIPSKAYAEWEKQALVELQLKRTPSWRGSYPVELRLFFFRSTRRSFDFDNMAASVLDVLQKANVIENDTMNHVIPVIEKRPYGYGWAVDKYNPRVEVKIVEVR